MSHRVSQIIVLLMCAVLIAGPTLSHAAAPLRVAILPVHDGSQDIASTQLAESLHAALAGQGQLRLLRPKRADAILRYHADARAEPIAISNVREKLGKAQRAFHQFRNSAALAAVADIEQYFSTTPRARARYQSLFVQALFLKLQIRHSQAAHGSVQHVADALVAHTELRDLDLAKLAPSLRRVLRKAFDRREDGVGALTIRSKPGAATVWLDGKVVGKTPLELPSVRAGEHFIRIEANRYDSVVERLVVAAGEKHKVNPRLRWQRSKTRTAGQMDARAQQAAALQVAGITRADAVVAVDVHEDAQRTGSITARVTFADGSQAAQPIRMSLSKRRERLQSDLNHFASGVLKTVQQHRGVRVARNASLHVPEHEEGSSVRHAARGSSKSKWVWVGLGALAVAGVITGVALSSGGGRDGGSSGSGAVVLRF